MTSNNFAKGLKRSALTVALGLCFAGGVQAQTNTGGAVTGSASAGDTITVANPATGFSRTITVDSNGSYRFSQLPTGQYQVSRNGGSPRTVTVNVGSAANVNFVSGDATTLDTVTVVGTGAINPIDVSSVESTTILTAEQINKIPVSRDTTAVALLAPGTVRGDSAFGNLASFGGASVAENQYFFNGFNITNTFNNLSFAQVPFEAIAEQQTKTGGYGAEFGRSTGGVINQISRRGTNEFHAGANLFYAPGSLVEKSKNLYLNDGTLSADYSNDEAGDVMTGAIWASGALIKDRLFAYGLVQYTNTGAGTSFAQSNTGSSTRGTDTQPKWLLKLDWNINDNNLLEFTGISDRRKFETDYYATTFGTPLPTNPQLGAFKGTSFDSRGGETYIARYTGYLTDSLTLSALAGTSTSARGNYSISANGIVNSYNGTVGQPANGCPIITDARPSAVNKLVPSYNGCSLASTLGRPDAEDTRDQYRIDLEWQLGNHLLRGGVDIDNFQSVAGVSYSGGMNWRYGKYVGTVGATDENKVVRKRVFQSGSTVAVDQTAFYIEDSWSVTPNFIAYMGLRWDNFKNKNGDGETFAEIKNQLAPRLGFSWDVYGDSSLKVYANAGRYALPLTGTVAVRGASKSLFSEEFFTYTGVDATTGAPTGLTPILNPNNGRYIRYLNNEFGVGKNPQTIADQNLKPMYQDEYILGFQKQMTDSFSLGARLISRDLKAAIDDTCDYRPIIDWALANGFTADGGIFIEPADKTQNSDIAVYNPGFAFCHLYNPGSDVTFKMDVNGDGTLEEVKIAGGLLGPKAKRTYNAFEVFFEQNWDRAFLQGSYTFAKGKGNTEGGVKSDIGQADTGTTQDFDYPELAEGSYGYLPNDRRHSLKLFGSFNLTDTVALGANFIAQSGRPINCFGYYPGSSPYGNGYFYCDGVLMPRGTSGRLPWTRKLDMNVIWKPSFANDRLSFKMDVFNVLNSQNAINVDEFGEDGGGTLQPNVYKSVTANQTPRSVRFMVQYEF